MIGPWRAIRNLGLCAAPLLACNQTASTNSTYVPLASALIVNPSDFMGAESCGEDPGELQSYQATLFDVTDGEDEAEAVPSSVITSCKTALLFENVEIGHRYIAHIDAYDRGDLSSPGRGERGAVDPNGATVAPTWTTTCRGDYDDSFGAAGEASSSEAYGVWVYQEARRIIRGCSPLERPGAAGKAAVAFDFGGIFPGLDCGSDAGSFSVRVIEDGAGGALNSGEGGAGGEDSSTDLGGQPLGQGGSDGVPTDAVSSTCEAPIRIFDLDPNRTYRFELEVFPPGSSEPGFRTTCSAVTALGVERTPECEPFQSTSDD